MLGSALLPSASSMSAPVPSCTCCLWSCRSSSTSRITDASTSRKIWYLFAIDPAEGTCCSFRLFRCCPALGGSVELNSSWNRRVICVQGLLHRDSSFCTTSAICEADCTYARTKNVLYRNFVFSSVENKTNPLRLKCQMSRVRAMRELRVQRGRESLHTCYDQGCKLTVTWEQISPTLYYVLEPVERRT